MADRTLLLQISADRVFFNPALSIPLAQTNIPATELRFKSNRDFYWLVRMERFDPETKQLDVEVLDYNATPGELFRRQQPRDAVRSLVFKALDWLYLEPQLSYYTKINLKSILKNVPPEQADKLPEWRGGAAPNPQKSTMRFRFDVPFTELQFSLGYVGFSKDLEKIDRTVDFKILNDHLLPEFEYIKFGLAQKLGKRTIKVEAEICLCNGDIEVRGVGCEDSVGELANFFAPDHVASSRLKHQVGQMGVDAHGFSLFRAPLAAENSVAPSRRSNMSLARIFSALVTCDPPAAWRARTAMTAWWARSIVLSSGEISRS
jgi:hypothetical protein